MRPQFGPENIEFTGKITLPPQSSRAAARALHITSCALTWRNSHTSSRAPAHVSSGASARGRCGRRWWCRGLGVTLTIQTQRLTKRENLSTGDCNVSKRIKSILPQKEGKQHHAVHRRILRQSHGPLALAAQPLLRPQPSRTRPAALWATRGRSGLTDARVMTLGSDQPRRRGSVKQPFVDSR